VRRRLAQIAVASSALLVSPLRGGGDVSRAAIRDITAEPAAAPRTVTASRAPIAAPRPGPARELLLSFDDGPDLKGTPLILDELDRRGLKAVFFVTGWRLAGERPEDVARRDLVRKIAAHGHLVANHTMTHKNLCQNPDAQAAEIDGASEVVAQVTGVRPLLFRAPYGAFCRSLGAALAQRGLPAVGWTLDPQDWRSPDPKGMLDYMTGKLARLGSSPTTTRAILLMHDTHLAAVNALGPLLDWIARENHRAAREGRAPITLIDYRTLLPDRPVRRTGIETIVAYLAGEVGASVEPFLQP
jgi:peptidoglycan/xylan/chitin deacetylase (PgdA/CDA1 family)